MKSLVNTLVPFFSGLVFLVLVTGCDTESADENSVVITPQNATIAVGDSITFTASGGFEYRWSLVRDDNDDNWATLSNFEGSTTTYTSLRNTTSNTNGIPTVRVLRVTSYIPGSGTSTNDTDSYSHEADAYIKHVVSTP